MPEAKFINPYKLFVGSFIPNWLMCRTEISAQAKLLYAVLSQHAGKRGECFPKQDLLAREIGAGTPRAVRRYIKELIENRLIAVCKVGFQGKNVYRFLQHEWMDGFRPKRTDLSALESPKRTDLSAQRGQNCPVIYKDIKESFKRKNIYSSFFKEIWNRYPRKIGKSKALEKFNKSVKTEEDWRDINKALDRYLEHLKKNAWKQPQDGKTWFGNWRDWLEFEEENLPAAIKTPFEQALELCQRKLSGSVDKEAVRQVLAKVPTEAGTVRAFLQKRGLDFLVDEVEEEAARNRRKIKLLIK